MNPRILAVNARLPAVATKALQVAIVVVNNYIRRSWRVSRAIAASCGTRKLTQVDGGANIIVTPVFATDTVSRSNHLARVNVARVAVVLACILVSVVAGAQYIAKAARGRGECAQYGSVYGIGKKRRAGRGARGQSVAISF